MVMISKNPNIPNLGRCVCKFWKFIHKLAGKQFKRSRKTSTRSDTSSSTNPNDSLPTLPFDIITTNPYDSLPTLPFDIITEILSRLPVKLVLQLRCVSKSWNSLISHDPSFAKKQLTHSTTHSVYSLDFNDPCFLTIYPPNFFFDTTLSTNRLFCPAKNRNNPSWEKEIVGSCNGILCLAYKEFILLWNPSIQKALRKLHKIGLHEEHIVAFTLPTLKGNIAIDFFHEFAGFKWLKDKPLLKFDQKGEEEELLKVAL
ncbi:putative F-box protein At5g44220 [Vicia villosa]|uniref:putative F-box protein At5g44220 n=1 Tax=Vicia villosa TaxID=3911 RepID=UPI00273B63D8|nr:putative F-box protein At5g44220 [Vicia villosa]